MWSCVLLYIYTDVWIFLIEQLYTLTHHTFIYNIMHLHLCIEEYFFKIPYDFYTYILLYYTKKIYSYETLSLYYGIALVLMLFACCWKYICYLLTPGLFITDLHDKTDQDMNNNGYMYVSMYERTRWKGKRITVIILYSYL